MSRELLLLEALCEELGYYPEYEPAQEIPSGQIIKPEKYTLRGGSSVRLDVNGAEWQAIVGYVINHQIDIEQCINDYGDLQPLLDYFNRDC